MEGDFAGLIPSDWGFFTLMGYDDEFT
ncbi:uncharacterized protein G2W53_034634 [Senna tora]|uniref:Uncharacterized protein n=1 Tax=Senna tora TaxID=362788 RepID=A0A834T1V8_9FABA|nr:uncharacterized protein G2W53_034634 [Senna tora]